MKTHKPKNRKAQIIAGFTLAALAATGIAYALWSSTKTFAGGSITAGDLQLSLEGEPKYWDVPPDRKDATTPISGGDNAPKGHLIELADWRIVPGDKIAITQQANITLDGDNLTAELALSGLTGTGALPLELSYSVYDTQWGNTYASGPLTLNEAGRGVLTYFTTGPIGTEWETSGTVHDGNATTHLLEGPDGPSGTGGQATVDVILYAQFDAATTGSDHTTAVRALTSAKLELAQVRHTGAQFE